VRKTLNEGAISGVVTDPAHAGLHDAAVLLKTPGQEDRKTITKPNGEFLIEHLKPGQYQIEVSCPGFSMFRKHELAIHAGSLERFSVVLQVGPMGGPMVVEPKIE
jgi:hypothetical protein